MRNLRFISCCSAALLLLGACQNNQSKTQETTSEKKDTVASIEGFVAADNDFVITPTKRPDMHVICKIYPWVTPESLKTLIIGTAAEMNQIIADSGRIITGPIMAIYDKVPMPNQKQNIVIGIPINKPIKTNDFGFVNIKGGTYHKAKTKASLGESVAFWPKVIERLKADGYAIQPPFIEYPSDTRTSEMTTVVTYSNLLIAERKP
jgi:effector-binding domain-containing protein